MNHTTECFLLYVAYKRHCKAEATHPVNYRTWLWLRGISDERPW
jgi:hypothetical protein